MSLILSPKRFLGERFKYAIRSGGAFAPYDSPVVVNAPQVAGPYGPGSAFTTAGRYVTTHPVTHGVPTRTLVLRYAYDGVSTDGYGRLIESASSREYIVDEAGSWLGYVVAWSGGNAYWYVPLPTTGKWVAMCIVYDARSTANVPSIWIDGVKQTVTTYAGPSGSLSTATGAYTVGNRADADRVWNGKVSLFARIDSLVDEGTAAMLSLTPELLFAPRRIWVPVSAAGGGVDLVIADATHAHAADAPTLTTTWLLTVADATHGHAAEAPTLSTEWLLAPADALHGHAADNLTLEPSGSANLAPADATHGHTADAITLTTASLLAVQDALHAHAAEAATLSTEWLLAPADATHAHAADNLTLSDAPALLIAEALHAHTADGVTMTVDAWLVLADATHGHLADNVVLFVPGGTTVREVLRLSSPLRRAVAGSSALTRTVALASDIDAESTTP